MSSYFRPVQQRLWYLILLMIMVVGVLCLVIGALKENIIFFISPSEWHTQSKYTIGQKLRLGGLVEMGSIQKHGPTLRFKVTDGQYAVAVDYTGIVPDLFREGQGVVVEGVFKNQQTFMAQQVLAKHDENYMPPEIAQKLKTQNVWRGRS